VAGDELARGGEAARREDDRPLGRRRERRAKPDRTVRQAGCERRHEPCGREAGPARPRVSRALVHDRRPERAQPVERGVEPAPHELLQHGVAAGALRAEVLEPVVPPDDPGGEQHRAAEAIALLVDDGLGPELRRSRGGDEPGHPSAGNG
jgi:hypothetical protein